MLEKAWGDELGVDFKTNLSEFNTMMATVQGDDTVNDWEVSYMGWQFGSGDDTGINLLCQTGQTDNTARLSDPDLDALLDTALHNGSSCKYCSLIKKFTKKVSALCPYVAINGLSYYDLYNKKIKNLDTVALYDFVKALDKATIE